MIQSSKPKHQAIWTIMFQSALDEDCFTRWNNTGLENMLSQLRKKPEGPIRIDISGRKGFKNIKPFYTFIGHDACRLLGLYLRQRGDRPGPIFSEAGNDSLQKQWARTLQRRGYVEKLKNGSTGNRYGYNLHRLRSIFRSRWALSGVDREIAEYMMGHVIDALGYDKSPELDPEFYEEKYVEASKWLNILSEDPQHIPKKEADRLRIRIHDFEEKASEVGELKEQIKELQSALFGLMIFVKARGETAPISNLEELDKVTDKAVQMMGELTNPLP